ncbi:hypothetical protein [Ensifer soli]|uniref:hypothetical protein n=1 Tax=Ciceribacter sp. sgz301302 TaxID=3342379 RepID=UPI0035BA6E16
MSLPLSRYLKDFGAPKVELRLPPSPRYFADLDDLAGPAASFPDMPAAPEIDIDAERRQAFEEGRLEAISELSFEHQQQLSDLRADHAVQMHALQMRCENELAAMIFDRFTDMACALSLAIGDQAARALVPVLGDQLTARALDHMASTIREGIAAGEIATVVVRGPASLFEALKQKVGDGAAAFRHVETADIDISVDIDGSLLMTRMAAWAEAVRKVLA